MDEPIGLKFCVGLTMTQENVSGCSELHKAVSKKIDFHKILKIHEKNCKSAKKIVIVFRSENAENATKRPDCLEL